MFYALLGLFAGFVLALFLPFIHVFCWSLVLLVISLPFYRRIIRLVSNSSVAAGLTCLLLALCLFIPLGVLASRVTHEVRAIAARVNPATTLRTSDSPPAPHTIKGAQSKLRTVAERWRIDVDDTFRQVVGQLSGGIARQTVSLARIAVWDAVQLALVFVALFFLLRDGNRLRPQLGTLLPLDQAEASHVVDRVRDTIRAVVYGNTVVALTQGALAGLAFWVLGVPSPLLWATATTAFCFLPLMGAPVIWIPAAAYLAFNGNVGKAVIMVLWGMLVVGTIDNVLRPLLVGSRTQLHPLVMFFCIFGGVMALGPVGIAMGPVSFVVLITLVEILQERGRAGYAEDATGPSQSPIPLEEDAREHGAL